MLHVSWDIINYSIGGIGDGIVCTAKGVFHLICDDGSVLPNQMYYSPMATETVISPTDIVFSNANKYDSCWQCNNCKSEQEPLWFYNSNGITTSTVPPRMHNKIWFVLQDAASTICRAKIGAASDVFIRVVSGTTLHNLWHHRICHACTF